MTLQELKPFNRLDEMLKEITQSFLIQSGWEREWTHVDCCKQLIFGSLLVIALPPRSILTALTFCWCQVNQPDQNMHCRAAVPSSVQRGSAAERRPGPKTILTFQPNQKERNKNILCLFTKARLLPAVSEDVSSSTVSKQEGCNENNQETSNSRGSGKIL